jgi:Fatty acid desaturase
MQPTSAAKDGNLLEKSRIIRRELVRLSDEALARNPTLKNNDALGFAVLYGSIAAIVGAAVGYYFGVLPAWLVILSSAFFMSFIHDIEHDLLHRLYFQKQRWFYNLSMGLTWVFRPSSISPWVRRDWHMHHHRASGTATDVEERGLLNGERWGIRRAVMSIEPLLAIVLRPLTIHDMLMQYANAQKPNERLRVRLRNMTAHFPIGNAHAVAMYWFLYLHIAPWAYGLAGVPYQMSTTSVAALPILNFLAVTLMLPNAWRTFCLYFVSSNMHYYGDIDPKNIIQQGQVWTAKWTLPLQAFCVYFGGTHLIHHFAVQYPFYMRLVIARDAHRVMREHGVRFNDFDNMRRSNRWAFEGTAPTRTLGASIVKPVKTTAAPIADAAE